MTGARGSFDLILNTIPSYHDYNAYTTLLKGPGRQVLLGLHKGLAAAMIVNLVTCDRSKVIFSGIGGIRATQEVQYTTGIVLCQLCTDEYNKRYLHIVY
jgi:uncharacterized zinc-type alcohol dehydrogenase-like protein